MKIENIKVGEIYSIPYSPYGGSTLSKNCQKKETK